MITGGIVLVAFAALATAQHPSESNPTLLCNATEQALVDTVLKTGLDSAAPECKAMWADALVGITNPVYAFDAITSNDTLFVQLCSSAVCQDFLAPWTRLPNCDAVINATAEYEEIENLYLLGAHLPDLCSIVLDVASTATQADPAVEVTPTPTPVDPSAPKPSFLRTAPPTTTANTATPSSTSEPVSTTKRVTPLHPTITPPAVSTLAASAAASDKWSHLFLVASIGIIVAL
ncbi:Aste57867_10542 [Aphanomyces stellatus]|uniref:Aste57867_10542 protein n=1 Tax=Aphanomyces stellatus TaxID=120398 RepID=A0A485KRA7_9STRA|nr:hypothetical protein As57867_010502 [Aphanomyces stellatus]VFT87415.1 Aste57867_10542 [Aphanomyces stellatus]